MVTHGKRVIELVLAGGVEVVLGERASGLCGGYPRVAGSCSSWDTSACNPRAIDVPMVVSDRSEHCIARYAFVFPADRR